MLIKCTGASAPSRTPPCIPSPGQPSPPTVTLTLHPGSPPSPRARADASPLWLQRCAEGGWLRPQVQEALRRAVMDGDLATLKRLVERGVRGRALRPHEATDSVSTAPPAAQPSPSALAARRPCCPALAAAADRVWRRHRASAVRLDGPH